MVSNKKIIDVITSKSRLSFIIISSFIFVTVGSLFFQHLYASAILYVSPDGSNTASCAQIDPCAIQHAIDIANPGDYINVSPGTYTSASDAVLTIEYKNNLTIEGPGLNSNTGIATLDGENTRRVIKALSSGTLTITGVVIQNGYVDNGLGSDANVFGGGILADRTDLNLTDIKFVDNEVWGENTNDIGGSASGGGLAMRYAPDGTISHFSHITFDNNYAVGGTGSNRGGYALGGGLYTLHTVVEASDIAFLNNKATGGSSSGSGDKNGKADALGGAYSAQGGTIATLTIVTATNNIAQGGAAVNAGGAFGGAFFSEGQISEPTSVTVYNAFISDNHAFGADGVSTQGNGGHAAGGGVQFDKSSIVIERSYIENNEAIGGDGAKRNGPAGGGGLYFQNLVGADVWVTVKNTIITDNLVRLGSGTEFDGGGGGGMWIQCMPHVHIVHNTIANNRLENQGQGEGWTQGSAFNIGNDGCSTGNSSNVTIEHSIIAGHSESYALWVKQNNTASLHKILWSNNKTNTNDGQYASGTIVDDGTSFESASVGFASSGNYHLSNSSLAIDQATDSNTTDDIDDDVRPNRVYADIGADEFYPDKADLSTSTKIASPTIIFQRQNSSITYTIRLKNTGTADVSDGRFTDIPPLSSGSLAISNPENLNCDSGDCYIDNGRVIWSGVITSGTQVNIQYLLSINIPVDYMDTGLITNVARLVFTDTENNIGDIILNNAVIVNPYQVFLPLILK